MVSESNPATEVPEHFICPITLTIMVEPLVTKFGLNFERDAILSWLSEHGSCPLTRKPMRPSDLVPNRSLEAKIAFWRNMNNIDDPVKELPTKQQAGDFVGFVHLSERDAKMARRMQYSSEMEKLVVAKALSFVIGSSIDGRMKNVQTTSNSFAPSSQRCRENRSLFSRIMRPAKQGTHQV